MTLLPLITLAVVIGSCVVYLIFKLLDLINNDMYALELEK